jgi:signal peptidase I
MNYNFNLEDKPSPLKKIIKEVAIWSIEIGLVILLAFFLVSFGAEKTTVVGDSMENTLKNQDKIIINKFAYLFTSPKRFDIIVFKQSGNEHSYYDMKRVIALPNEKIQIIDGLIYINGTVLKEEFFVDKMILGGLGEEEITLEDNEYFVLGDNRNNSEDSRFANIGPILSDEIIGKAWIKTNPFAFVSQISPADNTKEKEAKDKEE